MKRAKRPKAETMWMAFEGGTCKPMHWTCSPSRRECANELRISRFFEENGAFIHRVRITPIRSKSRGKK